MKTVFKKTKATLLILSLLLVFQCTNEQEAIDHAPLVNTFFSSTPSWTTEELIPDEDQFIANVEVKGDNQNENYECPVFERNMVTTIRNFVSVGTNFGTIWPGALIQGKSLETGSLKPLSVGQKRAPITLTMNLVLNQTSVTIDPNSANAQQAISDFMIAAGNMPEGVGTGTMNFRIEEATTFEQSMRQMGVSAGFTEPQSNVGLEGSLNVSKSRSSKTHTVVARFVQEMFTVRVADDLIQSPADFFSSDFSASDLEELEKKGEIGAENIPIYIESVTYGRIMLFSLESQTVESANKLEAALAATMDKYAKAGGELEDGHEEIFSTASYKIFSAGGTGDAANAMIGNLDWSKFFVDSPASTAVPISFVAKTVKDKKPVDLVFNLKYEIRDNCNILEIIQPPAPEVDYYEITVEWTNTDNSGLCFGGSGVFGSCSPSAYVKLDKENSFTRLTVANSYKRTFQIYPDDSNDFWVRSLAYLKVSGLFPNLTTKTALNKYNAQSLKEGDTALKHTLSNLAGSVTLIYNINKVTHYK